MHEKLNEQIDAMDEKVARIADTCLDHIEKTLKANPGSHTIGTDASNVKEIGEALKALADGLESYRMASKGIKLDATPHQYSSP